MVAERLKINAVHDQTIIAYHLLNLLFQHAKACTVWFKTWETEKKERREKIKGDRKQQYIYAQNSYL